METLHNARTGSKGLLDLERLCNLEPRDKQGQGHSSFIMLGSISTCLFPEQRAAGGAHWLLGRGNVPTFTAREGPLPVSLPAENVGRPRDCCTVVYSAACHLNLSNRILIRSQALHTAEQHANLANFKYDSLRLGRMSLTSTYALRGLCTMHMHTP